MRPDVRLPPSGEIQRNQEPLRDLKDLGGWKTEKTVVSVSQQPSQDAQRRGLEALDSVFRSEPAPAIGTNSVSREK